MKKDNRALPMIIGPTASGKTALAIAVAKKLDAEIVSADSIQVYKDLDIGSAKPNEKERLAVKHHLIDAIDITDSEFSVARFRRMADLCIEDIRSRDKIPLIVGGTGLYINSLTYPLNFTQTGADKQLRDDLQRKEEANPGILNGDLIVVHNAIGSENGDIVVARVGGDTATVKRIYYEKAGVRLQPENSNMDPIYASYDDVEIVGKVIGLIRRY